MVSCTPYLQAEIDDCKKINYIFGANGSGKSTISSFLSGIDDPRFSSSSIAWEGETRENIEVYDKAFKQANLQQEMPGIFTIGSAAIEEVRELELLKEELAKKTKDWEMSCEAYHKKSNEEKPAIENQFKDDAWEYIFKQNEADFKNAFAGLRNSKDKFVEELKRRIIGIPDHKGVICERQDLRKRAQTLYASKPEKHDIIHLDIDNQIAFLDKIMIDKVWSTAIAGSADVNIAALIQELGNSSWVSQGRQYIKEDSKKCPFCQQETITEEFRREVEDFFDADYKRRIDYMNELLVRYESHMKEIVEAIEIAIQDKEESIQVGKLNIDVYEAKKDLLKTEFEKNVRKIKKKITEPEKRIVLSDVKEKLKDIDDLLVEANALIESHNKLVDKKETEEISLRDDVWATCIKDAELIIKKYQKDLSKITKAMSSIKRERDSKKAERDQLQKIIEEKGKNITSVQPTIDEINRSLRAYGFTSFSIQPAEGKENYYCIKRDDGTYATNTLSEGEETFLTFLYFMQKTKGSTDQSHVSDKKIIVLDDPISSLDSTILYVVSTIVKDLSYRIRKGQGDVTQLFVLTHNAFFHKEASFINGRTSELKDVNYWFIRKKNGIATIDSYGMKNPISTSYELLWKELKDDSGASLISIQNTMRRIIENYFGMIGKKYDDYLVNQFDSAEEKEIAHSLLHWINDGSHSIPDDLFIDPYTDAVPRYKEVFRSIFEKSNHLAHYNMMMGIDIGEKNNNEE